jgi:hypothetical protein
MRLTLILTFLFGLAGFTNAQTIDTGFVGEWKLIETLNNPGDGSGTFYRVNSEKTLRIKLNGQIESNGNLCRLSTKTENSSSGQLIKLSNEMIFNSCETKLKIIYKLKGDNLIVYYPCKEGCAEKYKKKK